MAKTTEERRARVGVAEHGNSAELVTLDSHGAVIDRRRIDLTPNGMPSHPYHHEGAWAIGRYKDSPWAKDISLEAAIALIKKVEAAAADGARRHLEALKKDVPYQVSDIAIRVCPDLPQTIEDRIRDNRANSVADSVMYRRALADAAVALGWTVSWYDKNKIFDAAAKEIEAEDIQTHLTAIGKSLGPPWRARHKLAAAAALALTA